MTEVELYDATRRYWRINPSQVVKVNYAIAVYDGTVLEVYEPKQWLPALLTFTTRMGINLDYPKTRYGFFGRIADAAVRDLYINKSVADLFSNEDQNPIKYIWQNDSL